MKEWKETHCSKLGHRCPCTIVLVAARSVVSFYLFFLFHLFHYCFSFCLKFYFVILCWGLCLVLFLCLKVVLKVEHEHERVERKRRVNGGPAAVGWLSDHPLLRLHLRFLFERKQWEMRARKVKKFVTFVFWKNASSKNEKGFCFFCFYFYFFSRPHVNTPTVLVKFF